MACEGCRAYSAALERIAAQPLLDHERPADQVPELTAGIVARLDRERLGGRPASTMRPTLAPSRAPVSIWRIGLVALAIGQLLAALPALVGSISADALHANHDLAAVELALGACFLLAALRPRQAAGFIPLLAAVVACLAIVAIADVGAGRIAATSELPHLVDVIGLVMLVAVARQHPTAATRAQLA